MLSPRVLLQKTARAPSCPWQGGAVAVGVGHTVSLDFPRCPLLLSRGRHWFCHQQCLCVTVTLEMNSQ